MSEFTGLPIQNDTSETPVGLDYIQSFLKMKSILNLKKTYEEKSLRTLIHRNCVILLQNYTFFIKSFNAIILEYFV